MTSGKTITVDGVVYDSINEAARAHGLKPITVHKRIKQGWSIKESFSTEHHSKKPVTVNGMEFTSMSEAAREFGVELATFIRRLKAGWTPEQAAGIVKHPNHANKGSKGRSITVQGKTFKTIDQACRHFEISKTKVSDRMNKLNWTTDQAFEIDKSRLRTGVFGDIYVITNQVNGKQYVGLTLKSVKERLKVHIRYAKRGNGGAGSLADAIRRYGADSFVIKLLDTASSAEKLSELESHYIQKLRTLFPDGYNRSRGGELGGGGYNPVLVKGKQYANTADAARDYGLSVKKVAHRLFRGWTIEQALEIEEAPIHPSKKSVIIEGVEFSSFKKAAQHYGIHKNTFVNRLLRGWTLEQTAELVPPPEYPPSTAIETTVGGVTYESMKAAADAHSLNVATVKWRLSNGRTLDQAFELAPYSSKHGNSKPVIIEGRTFSSITQAAKHFNVGRKLAKKRMDEGWSPEAAFGLMTNK